MEENKMESWNKKETIGPANSSKRRAIVETANANS